MHKHLEKMGEVTFDKIFNQKLGKQIWLADSLVQILLYLPLLYYDFGTYKGMAEVQAILRLYELVYPAGDWLKCLIENAEANQTRCVFAKSLALRS